MALKGQARHAQRLKTLAGPEVIKAASRVLYVGSDMIRAEAFASISRGAVSGKAHKPSKPGSPPLRDTGILQAGLENVLKSPLLAEVSANAPYSARHEFGPEGRKFMRPARDKKAPEIQRLFTTEIGKLAKRNAK